tara:strand:+ start:3364 stop:5553 length:2190 start_codon:yes stop_codon:yes gene_type:complete
MKKFILYLISLSFVAFVSLITYFSFFEIKTKIFNSQIKDSINKFDKNLNFEIDKVQLLLNFKRLKIEAKILDPKLIYNNDEIEIESIKSFVSIKSLIKKEFALNNLHIESKPTNLKKIINLIKIAYKSPKIYILQNKIINGNIVADIKLTFDENGKINDDFQINGYVKDGRINLISEQDLKEFNFIFKIENNKFNFRDISFSLNELNFFSKKLSLINKGNFIYVNGDLNNKFLNLNKENILDIQKLFSKDYGLEKINFSSENSFSFKINNKFNISEILLDSQIKLKDFYLKNNKKGKYFFPNIKDTVLLKNHDIKINFKEEIFTIKGSGKVLLQNKLDDVEYLIDNVNKLYQLDAKLKLNDNPFFIEFLNYKKKISNAIIQTKVIFNKDNDIHFKRISIEEKGNKILLKNVFLEKDFKIAQIDEINLDYIDFDNKKNYIKLKRNNNEYDLSGSIFNADTLISKLLKNENSKKNLFSKNFYLNLNVDKIYLDNKNYLKNLTGGIEILDNKVQLADINARFQNNQKFIFSIKSENNQKITTLISEKAEPLVKRYKFIKGYEEGSLNFKSSNINGKSTSVLRIFNFKLQELPALTKLLTLASLQGIADTLTGEGIRFNELEMNFTDEEGLMTIDELYAIGPAISILMTGYIEKDKLVSLRGTLVPATTLNKTIGSIPFLGKILVGSKVGEGVFGVSFKIKGPPDNLETKVNPIKTLTPRFITRTLEKIKKTN